MSNSASAILNDRLASYESTNQYLSFLIGQEEYVIEILRVQEIIRNYILTQIPNASKGIKGMINFRGKVVPLINLRAKFDLPAIVDDSMNVAIVIEYKGKNIGMMVDQVYDIVNLEVDSIQVVDEEVVDDLKAEHLKGMGTTGDRLILLLDLDKVISTEDIE